MNLLIFVTVILLIIGFFKPQASLFWYGKERTTMLSSFIYGGALIVLVYYVAPNHKIKPFVTPATSQPDSIAYAAIDTAATPDTMIARGSGILEQDRISSKLKAKAERDWPNDYTTQEYWINQELEDYKYMLTITDNPVKKQAERDWPDDYTTQKYWYDQQVRAKERLRSK